MLSERFKSGKVPLDTLSESIPARFCVSVESEALRCWPETLSARLISGRIRGLALDGRARTEKAKWSMRR